MSFDAYGIHLGILYIRYYGIILTGGAILAAFVAERLARLRGKNPDIVWDAFIWVLIGGVIGARIWHILTPPASMVEAGLTTGFYLTHPFDAINLLNGGLGMPGAIIGGALAMYLYTNKHKLSFGEWADIAAPVIALGQAIGRWGNFVNNELYGQPTDLPWKIFIPTWARLPGYENVEYYHPLFLYESLLNLANFGLLLFLTIKHRNKFKPGDLILIYILNYGVIRFCMEFLRLDTSPVAGLDINQVLSLAAAIVAGIWLLWRHGLREKLIRKAPAIEE
jgi:phosphatidylglycerol---prolipoprotein diacylglyceryl transferase